MGRDEVQAERLRQSAERVARELLDPGRAGIDDDPAEVDGVGPAAEAFTRLEDDDVAPLVTEMAGSGEPGHARAHHDHAARTAVDRPPSCCQAARVRAVDHRRLVAVDRLAGEDHAAVDRVAQRETVRRGATRSQDAPRPAAERVVAPSRDVPRDRARR